MATTTPTPTPSVTPIFCGQGFTTGSYFYTDCCGNFVQGNSINEIVSLDYGKTSQGITRMNVVATTSCPTPTPTRTPTQTPTNTATPTVTPTQTNTPTTTVSLSNTPSNGAAYNLKNECDVFTLFDMGIRCQIIKLPSSNTTFDGILTMKVTGGTAPYSYYWNGGQRTQTLRNIPPGNYPITVVDYYGDYTANTICSIFAATPTPTPTMTMTQTVTPSSVWPNLCLIVSYSTVSYGPFQFVISGSQNGRPQWTSGNMTLGWSTRNARWEIQGWTISTGLPVSTNQTNIPTSSWAIAGGTGTQPQISMTEGTCPPYLPLLTNVVGTNTSCSGTLNCNGSISVTTSGGIPPYIYSINNGISYQSSNVFNGLCQGTYTVIIKDSTGNTQTQVVVIGFDSAPTTYTISASLDRIETIGATTQIAYWHIDVNPPITDGSVVQFDLNVSVNKEYNQPGTGDISDTIEVMSNSVQVYPSATSSITSTTSRPYCSPYETITVSNTQTYQLQINAETTVSGTSTSILNVTDGVVGANGCITTLQQSILTAVNSAVINGNTCSAIVDDETPQGITKHILQYGAIEGGDNPVNNYRVVKCYGTENYVVSTPNGFLGRNKVYQLIGPDGPASMDGVNCWRVSEITEVNADYVVTTNGYEFANCALCSVASVSVYSATTLQGISYACAETSGLSNVYYQGNLSSLGTILYQDSSLQYPVANGFYNDWVDSKILQVNLTPQYNNEGNIILVTTCPPPISYSSFQAFTGSTVTDACDNKEAEDSTTLYKLTTQTLTTGATVYVDDQGTPVNIPMTMLVGGGGTSTRYTVNSLGVITARQLGYSCV